VAGEVVALVRLLGLLRDANLAATPPLVRTWLGVGLGVGVGLGFGLAFGLVFY